MSELNLDATKARLNAVDYGDGGTAMAIAEELVAEVERLRQRLTAAETVCTIYGWTSEYSGSRESKATEQAYQDWVNAYGAPKPSPEWRAKVRELADRRDENRQRALAKVREQIEVPS